MSAAGSLPESPPRQMDKEKAGRLTLLSLSPADGTAETLTDAETNPQLFVKTAGTFPQFDYVCAGGEDLPF